MRSHQRWFARTALVGLVATLSSCILLYDGEGAGSAGAGAGGTGGLGGAGAGGAGAGGAAGPGGGGAGGGGSGGGPECSGCGPAGCDSNGICVISTSASNPVQRVLFVRGEEQRPSSGFVVAHTSTAAPADEESLLAWPIEFEQAAPTFAPFTIPDLGVGFVAAGGRDYFYYFGQGQSCDSDAQTGDSCINVCSIDSNEIDCGNARPLTQGQHVNGAVAQVSAEAPDGDAVFFVEANEGADEQLWSVNRACLEETETACTATGAVSYNAPDGLNPLGLDRHDRDGSLWWNTWAGDAGLACVYNYPGRGSVSLECVPTEPPIARPNRLTVSGTSVFVGTYAGNAGANPGPIQQLHRCVADGKRPVTTLADVRWPADADGQLLYATSSQSQDKLIVLNANTGATVASYFVAGGGDISWVDASNPTYVLFAAGSTIYRMLKPPKPCPDQPGASDCGNGCIETGEDCDDGNSVDEDACSANCMCSLPAG